MQILRAAVVQQHRLVAEGAALLALAFLSFPNTSQRLSLLDGGSVTRSRCECSFSCLPSLSLRLSSSQQPSGAALCCTSACHRP